MTPALPPGNARRTLLVLTGVALLVNYVETMIIPGVPKIQIDLGTTASIASWITSAYLIVGSAVAPLFGKLGDIYGKKRMLLVSLVFYMAGVALAGFASSIYMLIFARALQGIGIAILPLGLAIITEVFPREKVAMAQGVISGTFAIGAAAGLILGAYVVQDLGWPYAFHTALVFSAVLFVVAAKLLRKDSPSTHARSVDFLGAGTLMGSVSLFLLYVTEGPTLGWLGNEELAVLSAGAALLVSFLVLESSRPNPLIQLRLLRVRNVLVANLIGTLSGTALFLLFFAVVYYTQLPAGFGLGMGVIESGWTLGPSALGMFVGGFLAGKLVQRSGPKPVLAIGAVISAAGLSLLTLGRSTAGDVAVDLVVALTGIVFLIVPIVNMVAVSLPRESTAVGLGMNTMLRNIGGAIGPVVATTIMTSYTSPYSLATRGQVISVALPNATAFGYIFGLGVVLMLAVIAVNLATKNYTFKTAARLPGPEPEALLGQPGVLRAERSGA